MVNARYLSAVRKPGHELVPCPTCGSPVRQDRLTKHVLKCHSKAQKRPARIAVPKQGKTKATKHLHKQSVSPSKATGHPAHEKESFIQSFEETRYGDKGIGQVHREYDGKYGSLPLYDDYSDESGPD